MSSFDVDEDGNILVGVPEITGTDIQSNVFAGYAVGLSAIENISESSFIGTNTGVSLQNTHEDSYIGNAAGMITSVTDENVFIGVGSGYSCSGISLTSIIGHSAHQYNSNGYANTYVGYGVGWTNQYSNTVDNNSNVGIGDGSFQNISKTTANVVVGIQTLSLASNVSYGVFIGHSTLNNIVNATDTFALGHSNTITGGNSFVIGTSNTIRNVSDVLVIANNVSLLSSISVFDIFTSTFTQSAATIQKRILIGSDISVNFSFLTQSAGQTVELPLAPQVVIGRQTPLLNFVDLVGTLPPRQPPSTIFGVQGRITPRVCNVTLVPNVFNPLTFSVDTTNIPLANVVHINPDSTIVNAILDISDKSLSSVVYMDTCIINNTSSDISLTAASGGVFGSPLVGRFIQQNSYLSCNATVDTLSAKSVKRYKRILLPGSGSSQPNGVYWMRMDNFIPRPFPTIVGSGISEVFITTGLSSTDIAKVFSSYDYGNTWTEYNTPTLSQYTGWSWQPYDNRWAYVGSGANGNFEYIRISSDLSSITLSERLLNIGSLSLFDVTNDNEFQFFTIGSRYVGSPSNTCVWKINNQSMGSLLISNLGADLFETGHTILKNGYGTLIAGGYGGTVSSGKILFRSSNDGDTWIDVSAPSTLSVVRRLAWNGNVWIAVGDGQNPLLVAGEDDGYTWKTPFIVDLNNVSTTSFNDVAWNGQYWILVGGSNIYIGVDSRALWWNPVIFSPIVGESLNSVVFSETAGLWYAIGKRVYTSSNGSNWTITSDPAISGGKSRFSTPNSRSYTKGSRFFGPFSQLSTSLGTISLPSTLVFGTSVIATNYSLNNSVPDGSYSIPTRDVGSNQDQLPLWQRLEGIQNGDIIRGCLLVSSTAFFAGTLSGSTDGLFMLSLPLQTIEGNISANDRIYKSVDIEIGHGIARNHLGTYLFYGETTSGNNVGSFAFATSPDGDIWTRRASALSIARKAVWNGEYWVAVGDGETAIVKSPDGIAWAKHESSLSSGNSIAWNGSNWIAVGVPISGGTGIVGSVDGEIWFTMSHGTNLSIPYTVEWNNDAWVIGGTGSDTLIYAPKFELPPSSWISGGRQLQFSNDRHEYESIFISGVKGVVWNGMEWIAAGEWDRQSNIARSSNAQSWFIEPTQYLGVSDYTSYTSISEVYGIASWINRNSNFPLDSASSTKLFEISNSLSINVNRRSRIVDGFLGSTLTTFNTVPQTISQLGGSLVSLSTISSTVGGFMLSLQTLSTIWSTLCEVDLSILTLSSISDITDTISLRDITLSYSNAITGFINASALYVNFPLAYAFLSTTVSLFSYIDTAINQVGFWKSTYETVNSAKQVYESTFIQLRNSASNLVSGIPTNTLSTLSGQYGSLSTLSLDFYTSIQNLSRLIPTGVVPSNTLSDTPWYFTLSRGLMNALVLRESNLSVLYPIQTYIEQDAFTYATNLSSSFTTIFTSISSKYLDDVSSTLSEMNATISSMNAFISNISVEFLSRGVYLNNVITASLTYLQTLQISAQSILSFAQSNLSYNIINQKIIDESNASAAAAAALAARAEAEIAEAIALSTSGSVISLIGIIFDPSYVPTYQFFSNISLIATYTTEVRSYMTSFNVLISDYPTILSSIINETTYISAINTRAGIQLDLSYFDETRTELLSYQSSISSLYQELVDGVALSLFEPYTTSYNQYAYNLSIADPIFSNGYNTAEELCCNITWFSNAFVEADLRIGVLRVSEESAAAAAELEKRQIISATYLDTISKSYSLFRRYLYYNNWFQRTWHYIRPFHESLSSVPAYNTLSSFAKQFPSYESEFYVFFTAVRDGGDLTLLSINLSSIQILSSEFDTNIQTILNSLYLLSLNEILLSDLSARKARDFTPYATELSNISAGVYSNYVNYFSNVESDISTTINSIPVLVSNLTLSFSLSDSLFSNSYSSQQLFQYLDFINGNTTISFNVSVDDIGRAFHPFENEVIRITPSTNPIYISDSTLPNNLSLLEPIATIFQRLGLSRYVTGSNFVPQTRIISINGSNSTAAGNLIVVIDPTTRRGRGGSNFTFLVNTVDSLESSDINYGNFRDRSLVSGQYFRYIRVLERLPFLISSISTISTYALQELSNNSYAATVVGLTPPDSLSNIQQFYKNDYDKILLYANFLLSAQWQPLVFHFINEHTLSFVNTNAGYLNLPELTTLSRRSIITDSAIFWNQFGFGPGGSTELPPIGSPTYSTSPDTYPNLEENSVYGVVLRELSRAVTYHISRAKNIYSLNPFVRSISFIGTALNLMRQNIQTRRNLYRTLGPSIVSKYKDLIALDSLRSNRFSPYSLPVINASFGIFSYKPIDTANYWTDTYNISALEITTIARQLGLLTQTNTGIPQFNNLLGQFFDANSNLNQVILFARSIGVNLPPAPPPPNNLVQANNFYNLVLQGQQTLSNVIRNISIYGVGTLSMASNYDSLIPIRIVQQSVSLISDAQFYFAASNVDPIFEADLSMIGAMYVTNARFFLSSMKANVAVLLPPQEDFDRFSNATYLGSATLSSFVTSISSNLSLLSAQCAVDVSGFTIAQCLSAISNARATSNTIASTISDAAYQYIISEGIPLYKRTLSSISLELITLSDSISRWKTVRDRCYAISSYDISTFPPDGGRGKPFITSIIPTDLSYWTPYSQFISDMNSLSLSYYDFSNATRRYYNFARDIMNGTLYKTDSILQVGNLQLGYTQFAEDLNISAGGLNRLTNGKAFIDISVDAYYTVSTLSKYAFYNAFCNVMRFFGRIDLSSSLFLSAQSYLSSVSADWVTNTLSTQAVILSLQYLISDEDAEKYAMDDYLNSISTFNEKHCHEYDNNWLYYVGDVVSYSNQVYIVSNTIPPRPPLAISGIDPFNSSYWALSFIPLNISRYIDVYFDLGPSSTILSGTYVTHWRETYQATRDIRTSLNINQGIPPLNLDIWRQLTPDEFEDLVDLRGNPLPYSPTRGYFVGSTVLTSDSGGSYSIATLCNTTGRDAPIPFTNPYNAVTLPRRYDNTKGPTLSSDKIVSFWSFSSNLMITQDLYSNKIYSNGTTLSYNISVQGVLYLSGTTLSQTLSGPSELLYVSGTTFSSNVTISAVFLMSGQKLITFQPYAQELISGTRSLYDVRRYGNVDVDPWKSYGFLRDQRYAFAIGPETVYNRAVDRMYLAMSNISTTVSMFGINPNIGDVSRTPLKNLPGLAVTADDTTTVWSNIQTTLTDYFNDFRSNISSNYAGPMNSLQKVHYYDLFNYIQYATEVISFCTTSLNIMKTQYFYNPNVQKRIFDEPTRFINPVQVGGAVRFIDLGHGSFTDMETDWARKYWNDIEILFQQNKDAILYYTESVKLLVGWYTTNYIVASTSRLRGGGVKCDSFIDAGENVKNNGWINTPILNYSDQTFSDEIDNPTPGTILDSINEMEITASTGPEYVNDRTFAAALVWQPSDPTVKILGAVAKGTVGMLVSAFTQGPRIALDILFPPWGILEIVNLVYSLTDDAGKGPLDKLFGTTTAGFGSITWPSFTDINYRTPSLAQRIASDTANIALALGVVNIDFEIATQQFFSRQLRIYLDDIDDLIVKIDLLPVPDVKPPVIVPAPSAPAEVIPSELPKPPPDITLPDVLDARDDIRKKIIDVDGRLSSLELQQLKLPAEIWEDPISTKALIYARVKDRVGGRVFSLVGDIYGPNSQLVTVRFAGESVNRIVWVPAQPVADESTINTRGPQSKNPIATERRLVNAEDIQRIRTRNEELKVEYEQKRAKLEAERNKLQGQFTDAEAEFYRTEGERAVAEAQKESAMQDFNKQLDETIQKNALAEAEYNERVRVYEDTLRDLKTANKAEAKRYLADLARQNEAINENLNRVRNGQRQLDALMEPYTRALLGTATFTDWLTRVRNANAGNPLVEAIVTAITKYQRTVARASAFGRRAAVFLMSRPGVTGRAFTKGFKLAGKYGTPALAGFGAITTIVSGAIDNGSFD
jgi:hypothetical protein